MKKSEQNRPANTPEYAYLEGILDTDASVEVAPCGGLIIKGDMTIDSPTAIKFPHQIKELHGNLNVYRPSPIYNFLDLNLPSTINGNIRIEGSSFESFRGFPSVVNGNIWIFARVPIVSFAGFPKKITGKFDWTNYREKLLHLDELFDCEFDGQVAIKNYDAASSEVELFIKMHKAALK